jgi:hypothetical protein
VARRCASVSSGVPGRSATSAIATTSR